MQVKNINGSTVLHGVAHIPESLKAILALLPERQRLKAVQVKNNNSNTVLYGIADTPESLKVILALLPEGQRLEAVKAQNTSGTTVLHYAVYTPESLKAILERLPEGQHLEAVQVKDTNGDTVLHYAAHTPESLKMLLALFPERQRLKAVQVKNINGSTVLYGAAHIFESLKAILESLPPRDYDAILSDFASLPEWIKTDEDILQGITYVLLGTSLPGFRENDSERLKKGLKFAVSFVKVIKEESDSLEAIKKLLSDYTKHNSMVYRFFSGAWNRHHVAEVQRILHNIDGKDAETVFKELALINTINSSGHLAHMMAFIQKTFKIEDPSEREDIDLEQQPIQLGH